MTTTPPTGSSPSGPGLFRVVLEMDIGEQPREAFLAAWRQMARAAAHEPSNLRQSLSVDTRRPSHFYIVSEWTDEDQYQRFTRGPAHDDNVGAIRSVGRTVSMSQMQQVLSGPDGAQDEVTA